MKIKVPVPKIRKPIAKKPNTIIKTPKDYSRKKKHKNKNEQ